MRRADIKRQNTSVLIINASCLLRVKSKRSRPLPPPPPPPPRDNVVKKGRKKERKEREEKLRQKRGGGERAKKGRSLSKQSAGTVQLLISARLCRNKKDRLDSSAMTQLYECTSKSVRLASNPVFLSPRSPLGYFPFPRISVLFVADVPNFRTLLAWREKERERGKKKKKEKGWSNVMHANEGSEYLCKAKLSLVVRNSIYIS